MATFNRTNEFRGAEFIDADLRGARFVPPICPTW